MRAVFGLVLIVGLALAGFAVYMVQGYFEQQQARLNEVTDTVTVLAVKETVEFGEPILSENLQVIQYAEEYLPDGVFILQDQPNTAGDRYFAANNGRVLLTPEGTTEPRYALRQIDANEPLMLVKMSEPGQEPTPRNSLSPGARAFDIQVSLSTGASSFVRPGDRVDIFWTGSIEQGLGRSQQMTRLLLSGVRIVAVDQSTDRARVSNTPPRVVTVEVSPQQVGSLTQGRQSGELTLALVGGSDDVVVGAIEVDTMSMLGISAPEVIIEEVEVEERVCTVRNRLGNEIEIIEIPCTD